MKTEFDDALRGMYHEYDEVRPQEEDQYRTIGNLSVTSFVFGLLSILAFFSWFLLLIPILGFIFGAIAIQKIIAAPNIMGGLKLTIAGMLISFVLLLTAFFWHYWSYYNTTPLGYTEVKFIDFAADRKRGSVPDEILALNGQKIYVTGYIFSTKQSTGLSEFALVRTLNPSGFASPTQYPTDMILVKLVNGQTISYQSTPIRVGGILKVNKNFSYENLPYTIEAEIVR